MLNTKNAKCFKSFNLRAISFNNNLDVVSKSLPDTGLQRGFLDTNTQAIHQFSTVPTINHSGVANGRTDNAKSKGSSHFWLYPTPATINYTWSLGFLSGVGLIFQIITGIFLAIHYTPDVQQAFSSVDIIMREVHNGWFFRYAHSNGASMMFITTYGHILRNIYYRTYVAPRHAVWYTGMLLYVLLMATAFLGYTLPWGQMSYWGATVITSMFTTVPVLGEKLTQLFWGGPTINNSTIRRFFVLHATLPILMVIVAIVHVYLVHKYGSSNPGGFMPDDHITFASSFIYKDLFALSIYLSIYSALIHFYPNVLGHPDNYVEADPLVTPSHIVPEWYFLPYYAMLRAVPSKAGGATVLVASILVLALLPKIDRAVSLSAAEFRGPVWVFIFWLFVFDVLYLGWLGAQEATQVYIDLAEKYTILYFIIVLVFIPTYGLYEKISLDGYKGELDMFIERENFLLIWQVFGAWAEEAREGAKFRRKEFERDFLPFIIFYSYLYVLDPLDKLDNWLFDIKHLRNLLRHFCRYSLFYILILVSVIPLGLMMLYGFNPHS